MAFQYVLMSILLACAIAIVLAVTFAKSSEDGLSGTIVGGADTYYGKDKSAQNGKRLYRITMILTIVFALIVLAVYVIQPDYSSASADFAGASEFLSQINS